MREFRSFSCVFNESSIFKILSILRWQLNRWTWRLISFIFWFKRDLNAVCLQSTTAYKLYWKCIEYIKKNPCPGFFSFRLEFYLHFYSLKKQFSLLTLQEFLAYVRSTHIFKLVLLQEFGVSLLIFVKYYSWKRGKKRKTKTDLS